MQLILLHKSFYRETVNVIYTYNTVTRFVKRIVFMWPKYCRRKINIQSIKQSKEDPKSPER